MQGEVGPRKLSYTRKTRAARSRSDGSKPLDRSDRTDAQKVWAARCGSDGFEGVERSNRWDAPSRSGRPQASTVLRRGRFRPKRYDYEKNNGRSARTQRRSLRSQRRSFEHRGGPKAQRRSERAQRGSQQRRRSGLKEVWTPGSSEGDPKEGKGVPRGLGEVL